MKTLVTGGTGFIGRRLLGRIEGAVVATRDPARAREILGAGQGLEIRAWDPAGAAPPALFRDVGVVIHLAGEPIAARRWSGAVKRRIVDSRVGGTRNLVAGMAAASPRPRVLVSASAVGFYGDRGDEILDEASPPGPDFLAETCREWESEALRAADLGIRVVTVRTGIVLGRGGGALARMLPPFRLGIGGRLGSGRQWMPWIHIEDLTGLYLHAVATEGISGPVNGVAPNPVRNRDFTKALGVAVGRPAVLPVPAPALRLALGELAEVLLGSQRVHQKATGRSGYAFLHPELAGALKDIVQ